ncbi:hypothetical protein [Archangium sp.]|uniref:hypothetical protein n=1 Tax=Archangium sp. TaxID=1872627 RepID=UPI00389B18DF
MNASDNAKQVNASEEIRRLFARAGDVLYPLRMKVITQPVDGRFEDAVKEMRQKISCLTPCSGIYIWSVEGRLRDIASGWSKREALYRRMMARNQQEKLIKGKRSKELLPFAISQLSKHTKELNDAALENMGTHIFYVGKREGGKLLSRLDEHCVSHPQNGSLKLGGFDFDETPYSKPQQSAFLRTFKSDDLRLRNELGIRAISIEVINTTGIFEDSWLPAFESILRNKLNPIIGKR